MKHKIARASRERLAADLASLAALSVRQLKERWQMQYGTKHDRRAGNSWP